MEEVVAAVDDLAEAADPRLGPFLSKGRRERAGDVGTVRGVPILHRFGDRLQKIRRALRHPLLVVTLVAGLVIGRADASWPPSAGDQPVFVTIEHPRCHGCGAKQGVILDTDENPRTAAAYLAVAASMGATTLPVRMMLTPQLEPLALVRTDQERVALQSRWLTDRDGLIAEAGLASRRLLLGGGPAPWPEPGVRYDDVGGGFFACGQCFDKSLRDQAVFVLNWLESRDQSQAGMARATLTSIARDFLDPASSIFVAGLGSDSLVPLNGPVLVEGGYYLWTDEELRRFAPERLLAIRLRRPPPRWDARFIPAYNGLAISALSRSGEPESVDAAVGAARAIARMKTISATRADDIPLLIRGLLDAYDASLDLRLLERAVELQRRPAVHERIPDAVKRFAPPELAADAWVTLPVKLAVVVGRDAKELLDAARAVPGDRIVVHFSSRGARARIAAMFPVVSAVADAKDGPIATVCENGSCRTPTSDPAVLAAWLSD